MADFADTRLDIGVDLVTGTISSAVSGTKTVNVIIGGIEIGCRINRDLTVAVGDRVLVARDGINRWVMFRVMAAAPASAPDEASDPVPPPKPTITKGSTTFSPVETRSYRTGSFNGWRTDNSDVYQGQYGGFGVHTGCAFYGKGPASLKGATVTSASIKAKRGDGGDFAARTTTLHMVSQKTRPAGAPTLSGSASGPSLAVGKAGTFTVPNSFAQAIVDGTQGGLAIESGTSPYVRLLGKGGYSASFALTINWQR